MSAPPRLIAMKTAVPALPPQLVERPRLSAELLRCVQSHRIVAVLAAAGSGKTTAVVQALTRTDAAALAWLSLDVTEAEPGRLLTYLEAALRRVLPRVGDLAHRALGSGAHPEEAAGLLADAVGGADLRLVVDELERIADAPAAVGVLSAFLRNSGPGLRTVLIGRREVRLDLGSRVGLHELVRLDDGQLAFTEAEVAAALRLRGIEHVEPARVARASGGWAAGVLFERWDTGTDADSPRDADPLAGYLGAEILDDLPDREREFLIDTAFLVEVDAGLARALGFEDAEEILARLRSRYLPVSWRADGSAMRCHPRLREFFAVLLEQRGTTHVRAIRHALAAALVEEGRHEEAVEELLAAGDPAAALEAAARALPAVIRRQDVALAQRWFARLAAVGLEHHPLLLGAGLQLATTTEEFARAVGFADRLRAAGDVTDEDAALAAWAYCHVGRLDDALVLLEQTRASVLGATVEYLTSLAADAPPRTLPQPTGGPLDVIVLRVAYARGNLARVRDAPVSPWMPSATERVSTYRALGELDRVRDLLGSRPGALHNLRFAGTVRAELMIDLGLEAEAREALVAGRARIARSGSFVFDVITRVLEAKIELRLRRDAASGLSTLAGARSAGPVERFGHLREQVDLWTGFALLLQFNDDAAQAQLAAVVGSMRGADRILELPTAAVYLAEAEWRCGRSDASAAACAVALDAARRQGSWHLLLQALDDVPGVAARALDGEPSADGPWHEVARSLGFARRPTVGLAAPRVHLRDFGAPLVVVDGVQRRARIAKACALLAFLLHADGAVTRSQALDALFDGRADPSARAYLRQAIHVLRGLLPPPVELAVDDHTVTLHAHGLVESDSIVLRARAASAARLTGMRRHEAFARALEVVGRGDHLAGVDCVWVTARRAELDALVMDARIAMAVGAFEDSRFDLAQDALERVVAEDPYRERAWRLLMRIAAARGDDDVVVTRYRRCAETLRGLGIEPSESTRSLLVGLRR